MLILEYDGFWMPDRYYEKIPWDAVKSVERKSQSVHLMITEGQHFRRRPTLFYRMFPEQARYKKDDFQLIDCNRLNWTARDLVAFLNGKPAIMLGLSA